MDISDSLTWRNCSGLLHLWVTAASTHNRSFGNLIKTRQTCSPQLAPSTMAMQNASVSDVFRKMWPWTRTPRTSLCSKAPSRRTLQRQNRLLSNTHNCVIMWQSCNIWYKSMSTLDYQIVSLSQINIVSKRVRMPLKRDCIQEMKLIYLTPSVVLRFLFLDRSNL